MKISHSLASAFAVLANVVTAAELTFTYSTLISGTVKTTSTSYPLPSSHSHHHHTRPHAPTSYVYNLADNAYPTFPSVPGPLSSDSPAPGLANASSLADEAVALILQLKTANPTNCLTCQKVFASVAARMKVQQETLSDIATPFCEVLQAVLPIPICIGLLKVGSTDVGGVFPAMDMLGQDGQTLCAFMFGSCDLPAPPALDLDVLFKGKSKKPAPRRLRNSEKEPLKVLHISDYHLDMRYVVGSEAHCTGPVCCRVFPYTNTSAPIVEPASLFGNYLCDTPEPLATSTFRGVRKATGFEWSDFAWGIFTGDLVSHDIWELTEEYVLAEELECYQQFFDGMDGVKMFPTLG
jgi:hypothetical protein